MDPTWLNNVYFNGFPHGKVLERDPKKATASHLKLWKREKRKCAAGARFVYVGEWAAGLTMEEIVPTGETCNELCCVFLSTQRITVAFFVGSAPA